MNYQETLDYIYGYLDTETGLLSRRMADFDLRRLVALMARLDNPHRKAKTVHIAGTKGKGSTAVMIASVLQAAGYTTGLFTSPHLLDVRERIQVNGQLIGKDDLVALTGELKPHIEAINTEGLYGKLTTFEILTALAFAWFARQTVDIQVLEVGLGGRLDATNIVTPDICVITPVSLDHTRILGSTVDQIAAEKSGIIKPGCTVISSLQYPEAEQVIERHCKEKGVPLLKAGTDTIWRLLENSLDGQTVEVHGQREVYQFRLPLLGAHQRENAATAVTALEALAGCGIPVTGKAVAKGMAQVRWPGRFQIIGQSPVVVIDGAHNIESVQRLKQSLADYFGIMEGKPSQFSPAVMVLGMSRDKDIRGILCELKPLFDIGVLVKSSHPRSLKPKEIAAECKSVEKTIYTEDSVSSGIQKARQLAGKKGLVCITGSLFVVSDALKAIQDEIIRLE